MDIKLRPQPVTLTLDIDFNEIHNRDVKGESIRKEMVRIRKEQKPLKERLKMQFADVSERMLLQSKIDKLQKEFDDLDWNYRCMFGILHKDPIVLYADI